MHATYTAYFTLFSQLLASLLSSIHISYPSILGANKLFAKYDHLVDCNQVVCSSSYCTSSQLRHQHDMQERHLYRPIASDDVTSFK